MKQLKNVFLIIIAALFLYAFYNIYETDKHKKAQIEYKEKLESIRISFEQKFDSTTLSSFPKGYYEEYKGEFIKNAKYLLKEEYKKEGIIIDEN